MAPIAVATHADQVDGDLEDVRNRIMWALGLQNEVFMLDNSEKMSKTFTRDKALYMILRSALRSASEYIVARENRK